MMKALTYGLLMFVVGLSIGTYREYLALNEKVNDLPVQAAVETEQHIVKLPEDGKQYYTTVFLASNWQGDAKSRELVAWFDTNPQLASLRSQTHFNVITQADPLWKTNYATSVATVPCLALTDAKGDVVYKASQNGLPTEPKALASAVAKAVERRCPNRRCPVKPDPEPTPEPVVPDTAPVIPDTSPLIEPPAKEEFPLWLGVILGIVGLGAAIVPDMVKKYKAMG